MRRGFGAAGLAGVGARQPCFIMSFAGPARADMVIAIDKAAQRMAVTVDGKQEYLLEGLDRHRRRAEGLDLSAEAAGEVLVLAQIRHVADAAFDLL